MFLHKIHQFIGTVEEVAIICLGRYFAAELFNSVLNINFIAALTEQLFQTLCEGKTFCLWFLQKSFKKSVAWNLNKNYGFTSYFITKKFHFHWEYLKTIVVNQFENSARYPRSNRQQIKKKQTLWPLFMDGVQLAHG